MKQRRSIGRGVHQTVYVRPETKHLLDAFCTVWDAARGEIIRRLLVAEFRRNADVQELILTDAVAHKALLFKRLLNQNEVLTSETSATSRI